MSKNNEISCLLAQSRLGAVGLSRRKISYFKLIKILCVPALVAHSCLPQTYVYTLYMRMKNPLPET